MDNKSMDNKSMDNKSVDNKSVVSPGLEVHMPDMRIGRGTCRFGTKKNEGGRPTITLQFFRETVSVPSHAG
jgi:hypothetical protein